MAEQSDLERLLAAIANQYPFSQGNYPNMPAGRDGRILFAIRHIRDHTDKAWGAIAAATPHRIMLGKSISLKSSLLQ